MAQVHPEVGGPTVEQLEHRVAKLEAVISKLQELQKALGGKLAAVEHRVGLLDHRF